MVQYFILLLLCVWGGVQVTRAAEELAVNEVNFPDEVFRNYVSVNFDKDNSGGLSENEIAEAVFINVSKKEVGSLKGVEHLTALISLSCTDNQLEELDVSHNTALEDLSCSNNQLEKLDVSQNTALISLYCKKNKLTSLKLDNNTALIYLDCADNQLQKLDLRTNMVLESLYCRKNELESLDVGKNTALRVLQCPYNNLVSLNVKASKSLKEFNCSNNQLLYLDVTDNRALLALSCSNNQLDNLDINNNKALMSLVCGGNQLSLLDVSQNTALNSLNCSNNQLEELNVSKNRYLSSLYCSNNQISLLDVSQNTTLNTLICHNNRLEELKLSGQRLSLSKSGLHDTNAVLSDLQNVTITGDKISVTDITKPATYKVDGKEFTIIYLDKVSSNTHIFSDYTHDNPLTGSAIVVYGNGANMVIDGKKVNNKIFTVYTDITASYNYTVNNKGVVKPCAGKVVVGITKTAVKPEVNSKNKIADTSASKIARATVKNGQIKITALGKEGGLVYLWVIDTGNNGDSVCYPVDVKLAPRKLEVQDTSGNRLTKTKIVKEKPLDVCITGIVTGSMKTEDCTYTAMVEQKYKNYISVTPVDGSANEFKIKAKGLNNDKDTKAVVIFKCDQNGKKVKFNLTVTKQA